MISSSDESSATDSDSDWMPTKPSKTRQPWSACEL
ncbi:unnamed protein product [Ectocarpus sp. 6 AP-2014]